jgi:flagellar biosynthesis/type III secretory pathway M-ring protein FliF/YscJ
VYWLYIGLYGVDNMIEKYKEIINSFKELSVRQKIVYIMFTVFLTLLIMFFVYVSIHFIKWVIV